MNKEQFKGMLQSFLIKVNRANLPLALNDYSTHLNQMFEEKDQTIADLEAKLAEKESEVKVGEFWHSAYQEKQLSYDKMYAELRQSYDENGKLKQQLAEKTLDVERINKAFIENRHLWKGKYEEAEKDKTTFAIEKLEQVDKYISSGYCFDLGDVSIKIDQLIAEIKGENK